MRKPFYFFLFFSLAYGFTFSQQKDSSPFTMHINHIALSVKNVDVSADFYKSFLRLAEITNRSKAAGIRWFSLGDGKELHLISTMQEPVVTNRAIHFALNTSHFDALLEEVKAKDIPYCDWAGKPQTVTHRADGILQIYIQDPDGYWIELNSEPEK